MKQKYIFLDVDGTLFTHKGELPATAIQAIKQAHENGHKVFLCTGRAKGEIPALLWKQHFDGVICSAGAYVEAEGKVLYDVPMAETQTRRLIAYFEANGFDYVCETLQGIVGNKTACEFFDLNMKRLKLLNKSLPDDFLGNITVKEQWDGETPVYKMLYFSKKKVLPQLIEELGEDYTVIQNTLPIDCVCSGEISASGMNKAKGIEQIIDYYSGSIEDTVAFGDGANDYEMLTFANTGVAMGNSADSLKKSADLVTEEVDRDGLYKGFLMAGLISEKQV